ncbi:MAG: glycosyltransferase family 4 protein [Desulfovibrio sp.]
MKKMHTVLFTECGRLGGGSFEGLRLTLESLDRTRFRPVVVFTSRTRYFEIVQKMGIAVHLLRDPVLSVEVPRRLQKWAERIQEYTFCRVPAWGRAAASFCHCRLLRKLEKICRNEQVDLLYSNNQVNRSLFMPILAERLDLPLVVHLRSPGAESFCPAKRDYVERHVTRWIAISKQVENYWRDHGLRAEVALIPNGLPEFVVTPLDLHREFGIPEQHKTVVILARLIWEKAHEFLLEGICRLLGNRRDVTLIIAGDGPRRVIIEQKISELKISNHVVMAGYDPRGREIAAGADLVVQPSSTDSFSRAVMEAMRMGTPTVITNKGSALEAVSPGKHSLVVEYGDVGGLAAALEQGLYDEKLRTVLSANGRQLIAEKFDLTVQTGKIQTIMEEALAAGHPSP